MRVRRRCWTFRGRLRHRRSTSARSSAMLRSGRRLGETALAADLFHRRVEEGAQLGEDRVALRDALVRRSAGGLPLMPDSIANSRAIISSACAAAGDLVSSCRSAPVVGVVCSPQRAPSKLRAGGAGYADRAHKARRNPVGLGMEMAATALEQGGRARPCDRASRGRRLPAGAVDP